jgi:hypothetical protein
MEAGCRQALRIDKHTGTGSLTGRRPEDPERTHRDGGDIYHGAVVPMADYDGISFLRSQTCDVSRISRPLLSRSRNVGQSIVIKVRRFLAHRQNGAARQQQDACREHHHTQETGGRISRISRIHRLLFSTRKSWVAV